jgi:hypothetical protein
MASGGSLPDDHALGEIGSAGQLRGQVSLDARMRSTDNRALSAGTLDDRE